MIRQLPVSQIGMTTKGPGLLSEQHKPKAPPKAPPTVWSRPPSFTPKMTKGLLG